eukprot:NODE_76_length_23341_cov_0.477498.p6 type:complete len:322 gc:universal NODE_76_length_23341_cov_0.477498:5371-4406(-)
MKTTSLNRLNLMVVGRKGSGKTALTNTIYKYFDVTPSVVQQGHLTVFTSNVDYNNDQTIFKVVDSLGFSFYPNDKQDLEIMTDILKYIETQYESELSEELKVKRTPKSGLKNSLVDCILYVISPMQDMIGDIEVIKRLCLVANVIPVLSHADSMSCAVRKEWKLKVSNKIKSENIPIFSFMDPEEGVQYEEDIAMQELVPFLVCNADDHDEDFLGKKFAWGNLDIKNPNHTNLVHLIHCLLVNNYFALKNITKLQFYEKYRTHKLLSRQQAIEESMSVDASANSSPAISSKSIYDMPGLDKSIDPDRIYSTHSLYKSMKSK